MKFNLVNSEYNNGFLKIKAFNIVYALITYDEEFKTWDIIFEKGYIPFKNVVFKFLSLKGFKDVRDVTKFN